MEDRLLAILDSFNYPVYRQGSAPDVYPPTFVTFWQADAPDISHYDNAPHSTAWEYSVYVYSTDVRTCYNLQAQIIAALRADGWVIPGRGYDARSDNPSHIGRGLDVTYIEYY